MPAHRHDFRAMMPIHLPYGITLPDNYDGLTPFPLLIYLHGGGGRGSDMALVEANGLPEMLKNGFRPPFVVAVPQCPHNLDWSMILPALNAFLDDVLARYRIDPDCICLTGASMGGFGAWAWATESPERFAAVAPVCGGGRPLLDFPERLRRIVHLPVWNFHGALDDHILPEQSQQLVDALRAYGGNVRHTLYADGLHDITPQVYNDAELVGWLLTQRRSAPYSD